MLKKIDVFLNTTMKATRLVCATKLLEYYQRNIEMQNVNQL